MSREGRGIRLVMNADSMTRYQLGHVSWGKNGDRHRVNGGSLVEGRGERNELSDARRGTQIPEWETPDTRAKPQDFPVSVRLSPPDALATSSSASRIARTQQAVALPFRQGLAVRSVRVAIRLGLLALAGDLLWAGSGDR